MGQGTSAAAAVEHAPHDAAMMFHSGPADYHRVPMPNAAVIKEITAYELFEMTRRRRRSMRTANVQDYIILSFVDMNRNPLLRQSWFNCVTAWCSGDINHVELSFPSTGNTATVTLANGSRAITNKVFRDHYVHFLIRVGAEREMAARSMLAEGRIGREYDTCGLFDNFLCGLCSCEDPDRETCARLVIRLLLYSNIIEPDATYSTPQQLYNAIMEHYGNWSQYQIWYIVPVETEDNSYIIEDVSYRAQRRHQL